MIGTTPSAILVIIETRLHSPTFKKAKRRRMLVTSPGYDKVAIS
jgi:hypothetical protein